MALQWFKLSFTNRETDIKQVIGLEWLVSGLDAHPFANVAKVCFPPPGPLLCPVAHRAARGFLIGRGGHPHGLWLSQLGGFTLRNYDRDSCRVWRYTKGLRTLRMYYSPTSLHCLFY